MINLNQEEIKLFQQRGWLKTSLNLSNSEISLYSKAAKRIVKKAKKDKYPYGRVYLIIYLILTWQQLSCL